MMPGDPVPDVNLGAPICRRLKDMFFKDESWGRVAMDVAQKFTALKAKTREAYPQLNQQEFLRELQKYSEQDIVDVFG